MKDFDGKREVKNICMIEASFWIGVHDLLLMARSEFIGNEVGKSLSKLEEIDLDYGEVK